MLPDLSPTALPALSVGLLATAGPLLPQESAPAFDESFLGGGSVRTRCGSAVKDYIIEVNGPGLAVADFDGEGSPDLVVIDGSDLERVAAGEAGLPPRVFLNDGGGGLTEAGESWALPGGRWGTGGACADYDGDGHVDLLVLEWGEDLLFRNAQGKGFERVEASGFRGERWGTSAAFLDQDRDGFLDLCVVNYLAFDVARIASRESGACRWKGHPVMCGPEGLTPVHDQLYRNEGGGGFREVSLAVGFRPERAGFGLGVTTSDLDLDGDTDLYVTNDSTPNHLWENGLGEEGPAWREIGLRSGTALDASGKEQAGMGIACGDLDGDGVDDLFVTNFSGESNALYLSLRPGRWRDRAAPAGISQSSVTRLGWGALCEDFDRDGDLDLVSFNGHVYPQADRPGTDSSFAQPDVLLWNEGYDTHRRRLRMRAAPLSAAAPVVSRAAVSVDLEGDGRMDAIALELDGRVRLLRNASPDEGHWLGVRLRGRGANTAGLGARVRLEWEGGSAEREMRTAGGYQSGSPAVIHFGLGEVDELEKVVVRWPDGMVSEHRELELDRYVTLAAPASSSGREGIQR